MGGRIRTNNREFLRLSLADVTLRMPMLNLLSALVILNARNLGVMWLSIQAQPFLSPSQCGLILWSAVFEKLLRIIELNFRFDGFTRLFCEKFFISMVCVAVT